MDIIIERFVRMRVVLFGATGMVGQGVLRECLRDDTISQIVCVGRSSLGMQHPKIEELLADDLFELKRIEGKLRVSMRASSAWGFPRAACSSRTIAALPAT